MPRVSKKTKDETRARLLEAGARHLARDGLERASVDAIALEAGFAKGTFYNYFESKEALFGAVITEWARRAVEGAAPDPQGDTRARLTALAAADVQTVRADEPFAQVVIREALAFRAATYPLVVTHLAPFVGRVEQVLEDGVTAGEIRGDRPLAQLAILFTGLLALAYVQHWGSGGLWPTLDELPDLVVSWFLDGAAGQGGAQ
jgi:AcrR family transcriptional regulator